MGKRGIWIVLGIPAIIAFAFGIWVFYSVLADVSERSIENGVISTCVEGCQRTPSQLALSSGNSLLPFTADNRVSTGMSPALFH